MPQTFLLVDRANADFTKGKDSKTRIASLPPRLPPSRQSKKAATPIPPPVPLSDVDIIICKSEERTRALGEEAKVR